MKRHDVCKEIGNAIAQILNDFSHSFHFPSYAFTESSQRLFDVIESVSNRDIELKDIEWQTNFRSLGNSWISFIACVLSIDHKLLVLPRHFEELKCFRTRI